MDDKTAGMDIKCGTTDDRSARFTILIDADKKRAFEQLCAAQDVTASQMIRRLIRDYLERHGVDHGEGALRTRKQRNGN